MTSPLRTLSTASIITVAFMGSVVVTPLYSLYQDAFGFSGLTLTLIYAAYVVGNVAALLLFGQLSDQLGRKRVTLPGLALAAASGVVFLLAHGVLELYAGRVLIGVAVGILSGTGTAWLGEQLGPEGASTATVTAATANLVGIAVGPVLGGLLAEYVPHPLVVPFLVYVVLVVLVALAVSRVPDDVPRPAATWRETHVVLRLGVPADRLARFATPAVSGFVTFALGGLYFSLIPGIVIRDLHVDNLAVGGLVVCELATIAALCIVLGQRVAPARAMLTGLATLLPAVVLVVVAQDLHSLPLLVLATAFGGFTMGFGYRGSLQVVNQIAPPDHRAEMVSAYLIACFVGNALPVIGVGVLTTLTTPYAASASFAAVIAVLALGAIAWHRRTT